MKKCHTSTVRGRHVQVIFRDGTRLEGRFHSTTDRHVFLDQGDKRLKISVALIKAMPLLKAPAVRRGT